MVAYQGRIKGTIPSVVKEHLCYVYYTTIASSPKAPPGQGGYARAGLCWSEA